MVSPSNHEPAGRDRDRARRLPSFDKLRTRVGAFECRILMVSPSNHEPAGRDPFRAHRLSSFDKLRTSVDAFECRALMVSLSNHEPAGRDRDRAHRLSSFDRLRTRVDAFECRALMVSLSNHEPAGRDRDRASPLVLRQAQDESARILALPQEAAAASQRSTPLRLARPSSDMGRRASGAGTEAWRTGAGARGLSPASGAGR